MKDYQYYLFDSDGTLINTIELIYQSFDWTCQKYGGFSVDKPKLVSLIGLPLRDQIITFLGDRPESELIEILGAYRDYQLSIFRDYLELFPGVAETLSRLRKAGKKLAIVTSRRKDTAILFLETCRIYHYFDAIVTPETTAAHKPDAEPAIKAMEMLDAAPQSSVMIGDAIWDIKCGTNAGIDTLFVSWSHNDPARLETAPTAILNRMEDLLPA